MENKYLSNASAYHDMSGLQRLRTGAKNHDDQALEAVAKQLEGVFMNMMLKSMREANSVFAEGNPLNSKETDFYQNMYDQQISLTMAEGKGIGLADMIVRQMRGIGQSEAQLEALMQKNLDNANSGKASGYSLDKVATEFSLTQEQSAIPLPKTKTEYLLPMERFRPVVTASKPSVLDSAHSECSPTTSTVNSPENSPATNPANTERFDNSSVGTDNNVVDTLVSSMETTLRTLFPTAAAFVDAIAPYAKAAANELGVDVKGIIAQAALETGWGQHIIAGDNGSPSFNFFGIKSNANWAGNTADVKTLEYRNGIAAKETATFRSYKSMDDAFQDYISFLKDNPRYKQAIANTSTAKEWGFQLQQAGYATDPNYGKKIASIVSRLDRTTENSQSGNK